MAAVYLDENVSVDVAPLLRAAGHWAETTQGLMQRQATDDAQLLLAATREWVLLTHNVADYLLLHGAWHRWSRAWGVERRHGGIMMIPQPRTPEEIARHVTAFLAGHPTITDQLWHWQPRAGWVDRS